MEQPVAYASGQIIEPTGVHKHEHKAYPTELRFCNGVLQEKWECSETDYDNETSRTWKEWRDIPSVESDDEPVGTDEG